MKKTSLSEELLKKATSFCTSGNTEESSGIFPIVLLFSIAGILLGVFDGLFEPPHMIRTLSTPLPPSGLERLERIGALIGTYGILSLLSAVVFGYLIRSVRERTNPPRPANPLSFTFITLTVICTFTLWYSKSAFDIISPEFFGPLSVLDCIAYAFSSIVLFDLLLPSLFAKNTFTRVMSLALLAVTAAPYLFSYCITTLKFREAMRKPHRRVVLITIDTTRADHLGLYDYGRDTTPFLDRKAENGTLFLRAYSQMTTTDPSHTTILSGRYPRTHGLLKNGMPLGNEDIDFLQSWFKEEGFTTGAVTSRALLDPDYLHFPAFDYRSVPNHMFSTKGGRKFKYDTATGTFGRAKFWIDRNLHRDFFLWVHFWDPHRS